METEVKLESIFLTLSDVKKGKEKKLVKEILVKIKITILSKFSILTLFHKTKKELYLMEFGKEKKLL